jgi:glycine betaine/proline transport system substrate-binding protein
MDVDIKRGYKILSDNNIEFGIRITNNTDTAISDVQVILDCNESIFELQEDRVLKLGEIQPTIARTAKFTLKPATCVHNEIVEASIIYRDANREKHMAAMQAKKVHCICPFLHPKQTTKNEFVQLSGSWHSVDAGINYEGISAEQLISFLMQTCARNLYVVDGYTISGANVLHFSGGSDGNTHYLLTALIKENEGLTQAMFRAASDRKPGLDGFINEIVSELKHFISSVNSAKDIGVIKNELVTSIIDTVVPGNKVRAFKSDSSINVQNRGIQKGSLDTLNEGEHNIGKPEDADVARMYDSYLKEVKSKPKIEITENIDSTASYPQELFTSEREIRSLRSTASVRKERGTVSKPEKSKKKLMQQALIIVILMISALYLVQSPLIREKIGGEYASSSSASAENVVLIFFNAVNESDFTTAFKLCEGQDFLVPASIQMLVNNNGIEAGGIKEFNIVSTDVENDIAVIESNCTAVTFNIMGNENEPKVIPVYFQLQKSEADWVIIGISFDQPYEIGTADNDIVTGEQG